MTEDEYFHLVSEAETQNNHYEVVRLTLKAAREGISSAMAGLASLYTDGDDLPYQVDKSIAWDVKSIQADDAVRCAPHNLAINYRLKGDLQAYKYFLEKALTMGEYDAALDLACLYYAVTKKEKQKVIHYLLTFINSESAWEDEVEEAKTLLKHVKSNKPVDILKDCLTGFSAKQKKTRVAPTQEHNVIEDRLIEAIINYEKGIYLKARKQFSALAMEQQNTIAMNYLGDIYSFGQGVIKDYDKAAKWYHWSVDLGDIEGMLKLARFYKDIRKMPLYKYFLEMAQYNGSDQATLLLAKFYNISEKETAKVKQLLKKIMNSKTATIDLLYEAEVLLGQLK